MNRTILFSLLPLLAASVLGAGSHARVHSREANQAAVVERVLDGDTVVIRGTRERVRLANIDAPEMSHGHGKPGQPFSIQATRWMQRKVQGKGVILRCPDQDRYGRPVCDVFLDGEYINRELVRAGLAWANTAHRGYLRDKTVLQAQHEAQDNHRGLWADSQPTPPWLWRHGCWQERLCADGKTLDVMTP